MAELTLKEYTASHSLRETAEGLGITKGGVWQMLRDNRDIRLKIDMTGEIIEAWERKDIGQITKLQEG